MNSEHPTPVITPVTQHQVDRARQGELVLQQCSTDATIWYPPSTHCPTCLGTDFTWARASGRATLWSWVRIHQPYLKAFRDEVPYLVAYVQLEEGPTLITTLVDTGDHELTIDQPLELTFDAYGVDEIPMPVFRSASGSDRSPLRPRARSTIRRSMDNSTIHAVADAHGRSVRDGDSERARADVSPEFREGAGAIARALPHPVTSYEVVTASVRDDEVGVVHIRYSGPDSAVAVESEWSMKDGRPVMVSAHIV